MQQAGKLSQRITFQQKSVTRNAIGEEIVSWNDVVTTWANVMPLRGNAFFSANSQQHVVDARFLIRSRSGLTTDMRVLWKSIPYDISNIIQGTDNYAGTLEIVAVNGVRDGR